MPKELNQEELDALSLERDSGPDFLSQDQINRIMRSPITANMYRYQVVENRIKEEAEKTGLKTLDEVYNFGRQVDLINHIAGLCNSSRPQINQKNIWNVFNYLTIVSIEDRISHWRRDTNSEPDKIFPIYEVELWLEVNKLMIFTPLERNRIFGKIRGRISKQKIQSD